MKNRYRNAHENTMHTSGSEQEACLKHIIITLTIVINANQSPSSLTKRFILTLQWSSQSIQPLTTIIFVFIIFITRTTITTISVFSKWRAMSFSLKSDKRASSETQERYTWAEIGDHNTILYWFSSLSLSLLPTKEVKGQAQAIRLPQRELTVPAGKHSVLNTVRGGEEIPSL